MFLIIGAQFKINFSALFDYYKITYAIVELLSQFSTLVAGVIYLHFLNDILLYYLKTNLISKKRIYRAEEIAAIFV